MVIGVPKEIKNNENRVALTPAGTKELTKRGHFVYIQSGAGSGSGFADEEYLGAGAEMLDSAQEIFSRAEMIVKVKEPVGDEYGMIRKDQLVFTYFHFASNEPLTRAMIDSGAICLSYETVEKADGSLPLLIPMSEVAGRMAIQEGAKYLEKPLKGRGILLGGVPGVRPAKVLVLGAGVVGTNAAKIAAGMGADVIVVDVNLARLRYLDDVMPGNVRTLVSNEYAIRQLLPEVDLIVGAVLIPGAKAPRLITRDMLKHMRPGTVLVDVAVDQGGCIETCTPTTHENPTYVIDGVVHYCVANMPGAVPHTSTLALTNATLPYAVKLANYGWVNACRDNDDLRRGLNIIRGDVVYPAVAEAFNLPYTPIEKYIPLRQS
jgi:alanine dehydrogenase